MANSPSRILTHRKHRKLTESQVVLLLTEYVETDTTYELLALKFNHSATGVSQIVRGLTYRDLASIGRLRERAQAKAALRSGRHSKAKPLRVPDATKVAFAVHPSSASEIREAIADLKAMLSLLDGSVGEVSG